MSTVQMSNDFGRRAGVRDSNARVTNLLLRSSTVVLRYGLVLLVLWFGLFKFTPTEAQAIQPLVANSPLLSWVYDVSDVRGASRLIGFAEIAIALLIATRSFSPRASAVGSIGAVIMFLTTLSFLVTTPGSWGRVDGFPVPVGAGGFLIKDLLLLGAALWSASESLTAAASRRAFTPFGSR